MFLKLARVLCIIKILGIGVTVTAAAIEIETIMGSGPLVSSVGIGVAVGGFIYKRFSAIAFGLSGLLMSLFIFALIVTQKWGPSKAEFPVVIILLGYEMFFVPVGILARCELSMLSQERPPHARWQFSMRTMLAGVVLAAISFAVSRLAYDLGGEAILAITIGAGIAVLLSTVLTIVLPLLRSSPGQSVPATSKANESFPD